MKFSSLSTSVNDVLDTGPASASESTVNTGAAAYAASGGLLNEASGALTPLRRD